MSTRVPKEQFAAYTVPTLTAEEYAALLAKHGQPRGLLCDRQIRELAEGGMITPFVNRQRRHRVFRWDGKEVDFTYDWENNILVETMEGLADLRSLEQPYRADPIISYGLSSFGYDLRIADEFRIFSPATGHLSVVNPKKLDERALVPYQGEVCYIPPNSFALARSVETFHIPDNVLVLVVGKCVTGDTRIVDAETGAYLPIREAAALRRTVGMDYWRLRTAAVSAFVPNGQQPVYELTTRMGLKIRATANHPFRQIHGWTPLEDLRPGDRIAIARNIPVFGKTPLPDWEATLLGLMISEGQCNTPGNSPVYTSADPVMISVLEQCVQTGLNGQISDKGQNYGYRLVNKLGRGGRAEVNRAYQWLVRYGLDVGAIDKFVPQAVFMAPREAVVLFLRALFSGDGSIYVSKRDQHPFLEYYSRSRRLIEDVHHLLLRFGIVSFIGERQTYLGDTTYHIRTTDRHQVERFAEEIGFWPGSVKQKRLEEFRPLFCDHATARLHTKYDTLPIEAWSLLPDVSLKAARRVGLKRFATHQSMPYRVLEVVAPGTGNVNLLNLRHGPVWDTVESITYAGVEEVYDLTVPGLHNFVANDLIVHNSTYARAGVVVNVTPLEPGWRGQVTIEISNTTPLPVMIFANEGIGQCLFIEGERPAVTYADRQGKYQDQVGITLPRS